MTPSRPSNYYPFSVSLIKEFTFESGDPSFGPLAVFGVLVLVLAQNPVGVELGGVRHLLDVRRRRGGDGDPGQGADRLADGGEVVEVFFVGSVFVTDVVDFWFGKETFLLMDVIFLRG
jgi:hypothetical protein